MAAEESVFSDLRRTLRTQYAVRMQNRKRERERERDWKAVIGQVDDVLASEIESQGQIERHWLGKKKRNNKGGVARETR